MSESSVEGDNPVFPCSGGGPASVRKIITGRLMIAYSAALDKEATPEQIEEVRQFIAKRILEIAHERPPEFGVREA